MQYNVKSHVCLEKEKGRGNLGLTNLGNVVLYEKGYIKNTLVNAWKAYKINGMGKANRHSKKVLKILICCNATKTGGCFVVADRLKALILLVFCISAYDNKQINKV